MHHEIGSTSEVFAKRKLEYCRISVLYQVSAWPILLLGAISPLQRCAGNSINIVASMNAAWGNASMGVVCPFEKLADARLLSCVLMSDMDRGALGRLIGARLDQMCIAVQQASACCSTRSWVMLMNK